MNKDARRLLVHEAGSPAVMQASIAAYIRTVLQAAGNFRVGRRTSVHSEASVYGGIFVCGVFLFAALQGIAAAGASDKLEDEFPATPEIPLSVVFAPIQEAVLSGELSARVVKLYKEIGEPFKKDDPLVDLDASSFLLEYEKAAARLSAAETNYEMTERLFEDRSASELDLAEAKKNVSLARLDVLATRRDLDLCSIRAPFDGRIAEIRIHVHEFITRGQKILAIIDDSVLRARILVPAGGYFKMEKGSERRIEVIEKKDFYVTGTVSHVGAGIDPASGTFEVYARVANPERDIVSGMTGRLVLAGAP